ncbi:hypothetical protein [Actinoplanes couchii]|uniref:DUF5666 domain-containing protein n=1 Tax=Actinoplanes couchii TaxID=403638 RepID=A0ABQ3XTF6_9ACTN|nr:hypothetical protein [Actinoplanes couchii]MDR6318715.1 hypothetical protein [Actinoplanes couchii]GID61780.1 hypothetical protein Aco03nite_101840 [Actinoplanes couchii]
MRYRPARSAAAVAVAVAAALTLPAPAMAAGGKPKAQRFTVQGLVVASSAKTLRVLTSSLTVGKASLPANAVVTVQRPPGKGKGNGKEANGRLVGYTVTISGSATKSGRALALAASSEVARPLPAQVFLGVVSGVTRDGLTLEETSAAGGDDFGDDENTLNVHTSAATVEVDGVAGKVAEDEFVIVLGERDGDNVVAATVDAWTTPPDVVAGDIADVSGSTVTLSGEWGDDDSSDDGDGEHAAGRHGGDDEDSDDPTGDDGDDPNGDAATNVDLTDVPIVLNGAATVDASDLTTDERIVVLGETDTTTDEFTPQIAFAFNDRDHRPATHRHHHD